MNLNNNRSKLLASDFELKFFFILGAVLSVIVILSFVFGQKVERGNVSSPSKVVVDPFEHINLVAKSAFVYDIRSKKVLYSKNSAERLPLASLTKVMSALVATDLAPSYSTVTITKNAISSEGDSGLRVGEKWNLKNLLDFSLTASSNDGMTAVAMALGALNNSSATELDARKDFINLMNQKANSLNMKNTYYFNETGLDVSNQKGGAYGTAEDTATLFAYVLLNNPDLLEATTKSKIKTTSMDKYFHEAKNTDTITSNIPGLKASKTGFSDLAGGNLVIAFDPELGRPIVVSVLGSTETDRFEDVLKLVNASIEAIQINQK